MKEMLFPNAALVFLVEKNKKKKKKLGKYCEMVLDEISFIMFLFGGKYSY